MASGRMLKIRISQSRRFSKLKSDKSRLLYLMMLPHLDIKGRLDADPAIIKGIVTPLLQFSVRKIFDCLLDLHDVGLIQLYEANRDTFLEYYRFADFQNLRTDREADSEIPDPPELPESAGITPPQVKLSKDKSKISLSKEKPGEFPDNLNDPKFLKAWEDWQKHRTEIKHKLTPITIERQLKMLSGVPIDNAVAIIETSIQNGWQGLFPDRLETHSATKKTKLYPLRGGQNCSKRGCGRPAVHKDSSGSYDSFSCSKHLPAKMKEDFE